MNTFVPNMIKFYGVEHSKGFKFEPPISFVPSIATSISSHERGSHLLIKITDQKKEKYFN